ncbi:MAG: PEP-CTERM sorting domain-containing protein [Phycisphaeraceae bacterium]
MKHTRNTLLPAIGLLSTAMVAGHAQAQTTLFRDTFSRPADTDLNASNAGKSGSLGTLDWVEINIDGEAETDGSNRLKLESNASAGDKGVVVYPDANFNGLTSFEIEMRILNGSSGGNGRFLGMSVGQSKAELDAIAGADPARSVGDFYIGYDNIGTDRGLNIRHNGANQTTINATTIAGFGYPDTLTVKFTFDDMNAGTTLNYEVLFEGITGDPAVSVYTGSTTWSGTDENYIALSSNYLNGAFLNYFQVVGEEAPTSVPGDTDGDGDIDDSDLGTAFSNYTGPLAPGTGTKTAADGDTDGDGDVDDSDLGTAFSGYTGPLNAPVPEPTSLALVGLGGLALIRRRRA